MLYSLFERGSGCDADGATPLSRAKTGERLLKLCTGNFEVLKICNDLRDL